MTQPGGGTGGYPPRAEMAARYGEATGRDLSRAGVSTRRSRCSSSAVILEGTYTRQHAAGVPDSRELMAEPVPVSSAGRVRVRPTGERR